MRITALTGGSVRRAYASVITAIIVVALLPISTSSAAVGGCGGSPDFDGDGRDDLAVGVPFEDLPASEQQGTHDAAGAVHVIYGTATGLTASGDQFLHQDTTGMTGEAESGDQFGSALATGDFDSDGRDDLAVGVPGQDVGGDDFAGAVHIIYGTAAGLTTSGDRIFAQGFSGLDDAADLGEEFGRALAACDFDGDGRDDLAVGLFGQEVNDEDGAGAVHIIYGTPDGLTSLDNSVLNQDTEGMNGTAEANDQFGASLAAGDFNGDGRGDLAVGVVRQIVGESNVAGAVHVLYGSAAGITSAGDQVFNQDTSGLADVAEPFDTFGRALAAGDFDADGRDDLAVGVPAEGVGEVVLIGVQGAVAIIYGSASGLTTSGDQFFHQNTSGMADTAETFDEFGRALAAGDFDGDGRDDLAVGVPGESLDFPFAGAVHVIYGSSSGLTVSGDQFFHQDSSGMADAGAAGESFGAAVSSGDFDSDGRDDVAIGIPGQDVSGQEDAGSVHIVGGSVAGLTSSGDQVITQDTSGMADASEELDSFGISLTRSPLL